MNDLKKTGPVPLSNQPYELIQAHILDPENSPLPDRLRGQYERVLQAARLLDEYPNDQHVISLMMAKYHVSVTTIRHDISLARTLFKTRHTFDWDFWQAWQIKDQVQLIRECRLQNKLKEWNNAKKTLLKMIGEKPEAVEDPRRMERNVFNIQVNYNGQTLALDFDKLRGLPASQKQILIKELLYEQATDAQAEDIFNS